MRRYVTPICTARLPSSGEDAASKSGLVTDAQLGMGLGFYP
jgi:hypothetical protein